MSKLGDCDLGQILEFAENFASLGSMVTDQLDELLEGKPEYVNPNAILACWETLRGFHSELDEILEQYMAEHVR